MINVGTNAFVRVDEIEVICPPESAPIRRLIDTKRQSGDCIECLYGKRNNAVIVLKSGKIILSAVSTTTLADRVMKKCEKAR